MKLTPDIELAHIAILKADIESVANTGAVFDKLMFFNSEADFAKAVGKQLAAGDDLEVQFCQISFLGFEDDPEDLCEDDPAVKIIYRLHLFHEFKQERKDGTNSHDTFAAAVLNLRNKFLATIQINDHTDREALVQDGYIITDDESEFFKGAFGHWINLITKVELS